MTLNGRHFLLSTVMYALWIRKQTRNGATGNYLSDGRGSSGENREPLKLTTKPEPYTLDRTLRWIQRQVDPTLKMLETITAKTGIDYLKEIRKSTKLTEKHYKIIEQQTTSTEDVILEKEN